MQGAAAAGTAVVWGVLYAVTESPVLAGAGIFIALAVATAFRAKGEPYLEKLPENYKLNISNYQARCIRKQLPNVNKNYLIRKIFFQTYYDGLKDIEELQIPKYEESINDPYINFPILYNKRDELIKFMFLNNRDIAHYFYINYI